jgi:hypothetical protein
MIFLYCYKVTNDGHKFLFYDDGYGKTNRIVIFTTLPNLKLLERCKVILGDGTFRIAPSGFLQLYTIHGIVFEKRVPLLYVLITNKNEESYAKIWSFLKTNAMCDPECFIVDFEIAPVVSFKRFLQAQEYLVVRSISAR